MNIDAESIEERAARNSRCLAQAEHYALKHLLALLYLLRVSHGKLALPELRNVLRHDLGIVESRPIAVNAQGGMRI